MNEGRQQESGSIRSEGGREMWKRKVEKKGRIWEKGRREQKEEEDTDRT